MFTCLLQVSLSAVDHVSGTRFAGFWSPDEHDVCGLVRTRFGGFSEAALRWWALCADLERQKVRFQCSAACPDTGLSEH